MLKWTTLDETEVFSAMPYLRVLKQKVAIPDGPVIDDFYKVDLRAFALVVPFTSDGRVVVIEQYKHGPECVSVTFPAGYVEEGEDPALAASRELEEETGYATRQPLTSMGTMVDNGNQRGCTGHYFAATGCDFVKDPQSGDLEEMLIRTMAPDELDQALAEGKFAIVHHAAAWGMARARGV